MAIKINKAQAVKKTEQHKRLEKIIDSLSADWSTERLCSKPLKFQLYNDVLEGRWLLNVSPVGLPSTGGRPLAKDRVVSALYLSAKPRAFTEAFSDKLIPYPPTPSATINYQTLNKGKLIFDI